MHGKSGGKPIAPLLVILLVSAFILLFGLGVVRTAQYRPGTASTFIGVVVAAGFGAVAYVALVAEANLGIGRWLAIGLALIILGFPAWLLISAYGPASEYRPADLGEIAKLRFGYLAACWVFGLALAIFVHLVASPPGSLR